MSFEHPFIARFPGNRGYFTGINTGYFPNLPICRHCGAARNVRVHPKSDIFFFGRFTAEPASLAQILPLLSRVSGIDWGPVNRWLVTTTRKSISFRQRLERPLRGI